MAMFSLKLKVAAHGIPGVPGLRGPVRGALCPAGQEVQGGHPAAQGTPVPQRRAAVRGRRPAPEAVAPRGGAFGGGHDSPAAVVVLFSESKSNATRPSAERAR